MGRLSLTSLLWILSFLFICRWEAGLSYTLSSQWRRLQLRGGSSPNSQPGFQANTFALQSHPTTLSAIPRLIKGAKWLIPPLALYAIAKSGNKFVPLNKQRISYRGPFFQGWLIRTIDPSRNISSIFIVGSFSPPKSKQYKEHYIFCAIEKDGETFVQQEFPDPADVTVRNLNPAAKRKNSLNILWESKRHGYFHFTDDECSVNFHFPNFNISLSAKERIPWAGNRLGSKFSGPEGWLEYTHLLPCHYFIYSVGSQTTYNYSIDTTPHFASHNTSRNMTLISGHGYSHIEGNHGTFFPRGWVWSQGIGDENQCSFSLVIGEFCIGGLTPMNTCLYLRRKNGKVSVIRSIDSDEVHYILNGKEKKIEIKAVSRLKGISLNITIEALDRSPFHHVYVPTARGFSNQPGCQETYTALAKLDFYDRVHDIRESYSIPLTALEFGGSFIDSIHEH